MDDETKKKTIWIAAILCVILFVYFVSGFDVGNYDWQDWTLFSLGAICILVSAYQLVRGQIMKPKPESFPQPQTQPQTPIPVFSTRPYLPLRDRMPMYSKRRTSDLSKSSGELVEQAKYHVSIIRENILSNITSTAKRIEELRAKMEEISQIGQELNTLFEECEKLHDSESRSLAEQQEVLNREA